MNEIAPDCFQLPLVPRNGINAYVVGDVLVDAGIASSAKKIVKALDGRTLRALAATHAHVDHLGGARRLVDQLELPVWVSAGDAGDARSGEPAVPKSPLRPVMVFAGGFDGIDVARELVEGDEVAAGFVVVETPGHSPGHISFWRASDRVLLSGDVMTGMNLFTTKVGLNLPPNLVTIDPEQNRASVRKVLALEPQIIGFGHGPVMTDATTKLRAFVAGI